MKFSVVVVCLNPGEKLNLTLKSIRSQTYDDYEVIVKDGGSTDGSFEGMEADSHIRAFREKDTGIYDAMNQAVAHSTGEYILFMNCGDYFHHETVLAEVAQAIEEHGNASDMVLYGNVYSEKSDAVITASPQITPFTCYRNIPCHQACIYGAELCKRKPYDLQYRIRADYDHFLWCYFEAKAKMVYLNTTIASYEGGGFSESKANRKKEQREHKEITRTYMSAGRLFLYRLFMLGTLAPLRTFLADSPAFSGLYNGLKEMMYHRKRDLMSILLLFLMPAVLGSFYELISVDRALYLPQALFCNVAVMYLLEVIVLLCTASVRVTTIFSTLFLTILYSANYFVKEYRGVPFRWNDLKAVGTAAEVVGGYSLNPGLSLGIGWCLAAVFVIASIVCGVRKGKEPKASMPLRKRLLHLLCGILLALLTGYICIGTSFWEWCGFRSLYGYERGNNYHYNGFLVATCIDIRDSEVKKPEDYQEESVESLLASYDISDGEMTEVSGATDEERPHVILIMNEAFSDLRVNGELTLSAENMEFVNSLSENTWKGWLNVSVLGGGTANTEFEMFTGCTMGFMSPTYYPYQQCVTEEKPSLVTHFADAGYTTYAMHPAKAENWNRDRVYDSLGFSNCLWEDAFPDAKRLHSGVTDGETYQKIISLYESRNPEEKMLIFDLTMQNHGGYLESDVEQTVTAEGVDAPELTNYLSLIQRSDEDFAQLVQYFEAQDEKVIICMFGDHQPMFGDESIYDAMYSKADGLSEREKTLNLYKTPYVIWANYELGDGADYGLNNTGDISSNYLGVVVQNIAGVELSPYFQFLDELMQEYPVVTANGYVDKEGMYYNWDVNREVMDTYRMLQYHYLFAEETLEWGY